MSCFTGIHLSPLGDNPMSFIDALKVACLTAFVIMILTTFADYTYEMVTATD